MKVELPDKPRYGTPCNGCGVCCSLEICLVGKMVFQGSQAPCPALKISNDGTRTFCNLVLLERQANCDPIIQAALGIDVGCSMTDKEGNTALEFRMLDSLRDRKYEKYLEKMRSTVFSPPISAEVNSLRDSE